MHSPTNFDYHYFDDPEAYGYQGYVLKPYGEKVIETWEIVTEFCKKQKVGSAIDIGCAKGFLVKSLVASDIKAKGYDVSDYALSFAKNLPCYKHNIKDGLPDKADAIIVLGVLMYLSEGDLPAVLQNIWQASEQFFLFSSYYEGELQIIPDSLRKITRPKSWWRRKIETTGFIFVEELSCIEVYSKQHMKILEARS